MRKEFKFILIIFLMFLFSYKITYSEEKNLIMISTKKYLLKKILLNSFQKCKEYINETSVELFLNCSNKKIK